MVILSSQGDLCMMETGTRIYPTEDGQVRIVNGPYDVGIERYSSERLAKGAISMIYDRFPDKVVMPGEDEVKAYLGEYERW